MNHQFVTSVERGQSSQQQTVRKRVAHNLNRSVDRRRSTSSESSSLSSETSDILQHDSVERDRTDPRGRVLGHHAPSEIRVGPARRKKNDDELLRTIPKVSPSDEHGFVLFDYVLPCRDFLVLKAGNYVSTAPYTSTVFKDYYQVARWSIVTTTHGRVVLPSCLLARQGLPGHLSLTPSAKRDLLELHPPEGGRMLSWREESRAALREVMYKLEERGLSNMCSWFADKNRDRLRHVETICTLLYNDLIWDQDHESDDADDSFGAVGRNYLLADLKESINRWDNYFAGKEVTLHWLRGKDYKEFGRDPAFKRGDWPVEKRRGSSYDLDEDEYDSFPWA